MSLVYDAVKANRTEKPFSLDYSVTFKCNAKCVQCNIWKRYIDDPYKAHDELTVPEISKIFYSYRGIKSFGITGGEPFLRPDLDHILRIIIRTQKPKILFITTNGLLTDVIYKVVSDVLNNWSLPTKQFRILISVDGPPALHDKLRGIPGLSERILATLSALSALTKKHRNFKVGTVTLYSPNNFMVYDYVMDYVERLAQDYDLEPTFCLYHESHYYRNPAQPDDYLGALKTYLPRMLKILEKSGGSALSYGRRTMWRMVEKWLDDPTRQVIPCRSGTIRYLLDPYGVVYPCFMYERPLGNLRMLDYDLTRIFQGQETKACRETIAKGGCLNCALTCELLPTIMAQPFKSARRLL